jgi:hypothetical protein
VPRRRHAWLGFALTAALGVLALFVLHGIAGGVAALLTLLAFIFACMYALRGQDPDVSATGRRVGLRGWIGGWF